MSTQRKGLDFENMPLSTMLYEAADQLAGDGPLFKMLLAKAEALEERATQLEGARITVDDDLRQGVLRYVDWFGPAHMAHCPCDDTCDCKAKPANDAMNRLLKLMDAALLSQHQPTGR